MNKTFNYIVFFCLAIFSVEINAQSPSFTHYTVDDGLAHDRCYMITQDKIGFLYIATENGLCRFDGVNFKTFTSPLMKDIDVLKCRIGPKDRVWFLNLSGQLFYLENEEIVLFDSFNKNKFCKVYDFNFYNDDLIVCGDEKLLKRYNVNLELSFEKMFEDEKNKTISSFHFINENEIIYKKNGHLYKHNIEKDKAEKYTFNGKEFTSFENHFIEEIFEDKFLVFTRKQNDLIYIVNSNNTYIEEFNKLDIDGSAIISTQTIDNNLWILTSKGCYVFDSLFNLKNSNSYLSNHLLTDAFKDNEGNIWISSHEDGIYKLNSNNIKNYSSNNSNLYSDEIYSINAIGKNKLLLGLNDGNLQVLKNKNFRGKKTIKSASSRILNTAFFTDKIYVLGDAEMSVIDTNLVAASNIKSNLVCNEKLDFRFCNKSYTPRNTKALFKLQNSSYWIGSSNYLFYSDDNLKTLQVKAIIRCVDFAFHNDTLFVASENGLFAVENDSIYSNKPYLNIDSYISNIASDSNNTLWVATASNGLFKIENGKKTHLTVESGLSSNNIKTIFFDKNNNTLWIGTNNGLNKIKDEEISTFTKDDGLTSNQINAIYVQNDSVYIGTNNGLSIFHQAYNTVNYVNPNIYFTNIQIWDTDTTLHSTYDLNYNENNINIKFNGISFKNPKKLSYLYKLDGIDKQWVSSSINQVRYTNIPYGKYNFKVKAVNKNGIASKNPIEILFNIYPPIYHRWWFRVLSALLILSIIIFIAQHRIKTVSNQVKYKEEINRKIAELKLQTLHAQMNPHFIFNSMNAIQNFVISGKEEKALNYISKLANLIRTIFEYSKRQTISLADEILFLKNYVDLEQMRFDDKVECDFYIDNELEIEIIQITPMLVQPLIENAFKHGIMHKHNNGVIKVKFNKLESGVEIIVEDNGIGRKASKEINSWKSNEHNSSGLNITKERLEKLNNAKFAKHQFSIQDLYNQNNIAAGTKATIKLNYT